MLDLYKVGEKLGRFEAEKRRAVEQENYDLAMEKKVSLTGNNIRYKKKIAVSGGQLHDLLLWEEKESKPKIEYKWRETGTYPEGKAWNTSACPKRKARET